jgi:hypothetical protein
VTRCGRLSGKTRTRATPKRSRSKRRREWQPPTAAAAFL